MPKVVDLTGQTFGLLTVLEKSARKDTGGKTMYWCRCQCKNVVEIRGTNLTTGRANSCGCMKSVGEYNVTTTLIEHGVKFKREWTFPDLSDRGRLRFDFAVLEESGKLSHLIEFDGFQHWSRWAAWRSEEEKERDRLHDIAKVEYCLKNNIPLIRVPYSQRDKITIGMLFPKTSRFLVTELPPKIGYLRLVTDGKKESVTKTQAIFIIDGLRYVGEKYFTDTVGNPLYKVCDGLQCEKCIHPKDGCTKKAENVGLPRAFFVNE